MNTTQLTSPAKLAIAKQAYADLPLYQRAVSGAVVLPLLDVLEAIITDLDRRKPHAAT